MNAVRLPAHPLAFEQGDWGELLYYHMPAPDVYHLVCRYEEGYAVPCDYAGPVLSAGALAYGHRVGGALYFAWAQDTKPLEYELLGWLLQQHHRARLGPSLQALRQDCRRFGHIENPEYFGPYPPPQAAPFGPVQHCTAPMNGVFLLRAGGKQAMALALPVWQVELPQAARPYGLECEDFIFFEGEARALPLYALCAQHPEMRALVPDPQPLYRLLWRDFAAYAKACEVPRPAPL